MVVDTSIKRSVGESAATMSHSIHPNVSMSQHALAQMSDRGYTMADIDQMLGNLDPRLVVQIITVLPRETGSDGRDEKRRLRSLRKKLSHAHVVLSTCSKAEKKSKWTAEVERLRREITSTRERISSAVFLANEPLARRQVQLDQAQDQLRSACTAKDATRCRARIAALQKRLMTADAYC